MNIKSKKQEEGNREEKKKREEIGRWRGGEGERNIELIHENLDQSHILQLQNRLSLLASLYP